MTEGTTKTAEQIEHELWVDLWEFAESCIRSGDSCIDSTRFIDRGKEIFALTLKEGVE